MNDINITIINLEIKLGVNIIKHLYIVININKIVYIKY